MDYAYYLFVIVGVPLPRKSNKKIYCIFRKYFSKINKHTMILIWKSIKFRKWPRIYYYLSLMKTILSFNRIKKIMFLKPVLVESSLVFYKFFSKIRSAQ